MFLPSTRPFSRNPSTKAAACGGRWDSRIVRQESDPDTPYRLLRVRRGAARRPRRTEQRDELPGGRGSFDHLVGAREQHGRHGEAEHPGGLGVDDQLELGRLHDRQVGGLGALEDPPDIDADLAVGIQGSLRSSSARRLRKSHASGKNAGIACRAAG